MTWNEFFCANKKKLLFVCMAVIVAMAMIILAPVKIRPSNEAEYTAYMQWALENHLYEGEATP